MLVHYLEKKYFLNTLVEFLESYTHSNIILAGHFNLVMRPKEKKGGKNGRDPMLHFVEDLIQHWDLVDINPKRGSYTWYNNQIGTQPIATRLDRFLV